MIKSIKKTPLSGYYYQLAADIGKHSPRAKLLTELSQLCGRSRHAVRMWFDGAQTPRPEMQSILAKYFKTTTQALFPD